MRWMHVAMISSLDETIRHLLLEAGELDSTEVDISFEIPNREWSGGISKPTLNCYLFDIRENRELRQGGMQVDRAALNGQAGRRRAPMRVDLSYLVTAWTRAVEDEHRLLWHVLATLMRFSTLPTRFLQGELAEQVLPIPTKVIQPDGVLKSPGEFWTALENQIKPSLTFLVTLAINHDCLPAGPPVLTTSLRFRDSKRILSERLRIGGRLRDGSGEPLVNAEVRIAGHGSIARSDAEGRYILSVPQPGQYTLLVQTDSFSIQHEIEVPTASYDVENSGFRSQESEGQR
jgi:hypothetical protein